MITIKNKYLELMINNKETLENIKNKSFPMKIGYWINKGISSAFREIEFYLSEKIKIINKYAEKDENNNLIKSDGDMVRIKDMNSFNKEMIELMNIEIELTNAQKIDIDLNDPNLPSLSLEEQAIIEPFINIKE